jgi:DNA polymerase-3 subunit epsilon
LHKTGGPCFNKQIRLCNGACVQSESPEVYNERALAAIDRISFRNESFFIIDKGRTATEQAVVLVERGQYKGFGYVETVFGQPGQEELRDCIKSYHHNKDIQKIVLGFIKQGVKKILFESQSAF